MVLRIWNVGNCPGADPIVVIHFLSIMLSIRRLEGKQNSENTYQKNVNNVIPNFLLFFIFENFR